MKNPHLEMLSEMVRRGEPITMQEAMDVIEYQTQIKKQREEKQKLWWVLWGSTPIGQLINFFKNK